MSKWLLFTGGIFNGLFAIFHIFLGWQIQQMPGIAPGHRAMMQMLNIGGILLMAFAALVSLLCARDLNTTKLGKAVMVLIALFYASRAVEEIVLPPHPSPVILGVCLAVAAIYGLAIARSSTFSPDFHLPTDIVCP